MVIGVEQKVMREGGAKSNLTQIGEEIMKKKYMVGKRLKSVTDIEALSTTRDIRYSVAEGDSIAIGNDWVFYVSHIPIPGTITWVDQNTSPEMFWSVIDPDKSYAPEYIRNCEQRVAREVIFVTRAQIREKEETNRWYEHRLEYVLSRLPVLEHELQIPILEDLGLDVAMKETSPRNSIEPKNLKNAGKYD